MPVRIVIDPATSGSRVTISGVLDESVSLAALAAKTVAPVVIDLADVRVIDSIGVREWVDFLRALPRPVVLERCSEALVYQFGMIKETLQDARVASFFAPLECEQCGREERIEVDVASADRVRGPVTLPGVVCRSCGGGLALAEHPERFLGFLDG